jgi:SAM-dependent methyltransferase
VVPTELSRTNGPGPGTQQHQAEVLANEALWARKPLLATIYRDFYSEIAGHLAQGPGHTVELGSGTGLIREVVPDCIVTDLFPTSHVDRIENAYALGFSDGSLRNLILVDVFHHLQYPGAALAEFGRVLAPGGRALLFEPTVSLVGLLAYGPLHREGLGLRRPLEWWPPPGFRPQAAPFYAAQGNAWRVFRGDGFRDRLEGWTVEVRRYSAMAYLASGGYRGPQLYPSRLYPQLRRLDGWLSSLPTLFAGRMLVVLEWTAPQVVPGPSPSPREGQQ